MFEAFTNDQLFGRSYSLCLFAMFDIILYKDHLTNKLQNGTIQLIAKIGQIQNICLV